MKKIVLITIVLVCFIASVQAQQQSQNLSESAQRTTTFALKTNLLYGAGAFTPNLGVEFAVGSKMTLHISGGYNPWNLSAGQTNNNKKLVHWVLRPEARYWLDARFKGHFFGIHALGSQFNISGYDLPLLLGKDSKDFRHQGYAIGGGISYGYLWNWNLRWGMEFSVGVGAAHLNYDKYDCVKCGALLGNSSKTYFGPTNAGITLVYKIGRPSLSTSAPAPSVYVPPMIVQEPKREPVVMQPIAEPAPEPTPTTAERLAVTKSFLAPLGEYADKFSVNPQKYIAEHRDGSLSIYFAQGAKTVELGYRNNLSTMTELLSVVREIENSADSRVARVVIAGFASPEGTAELNDRLAHERAVAIKSYLMHNSTQTSDIVHIHNGGVDWQGLRKLVAESDMYQKQGILNIIDNASEKTNYRTNTSPKKSLMDIDNGRAWREMNTEFFPQLRNATYIRVYYENR